MLEYTVEPLPPTWPGKQAPSYQRTRAPFKTIWTRALALLEREIRMLGGTNVRIAVDVEPHHLRQDGQLRANARPRSPAVIVSFDTREQGRLAFPADRFLYWEANVDAIARALEDLRRVDRYGVQQGRQYTGFKALPGAGQSSTTMTVDHASRLIARLADINPQLVAYNAEKARWAVRVAAAKTHPDAGGSADDFSLVQAAKRVLEQQHGGAF